MEKSVKKYRILYIEDEQYNRILVRKILELHNCEVAEAEDGLSGIDIAKNGNFDLILLDINMEGMNGYEIATRLKTMEKCKNIPLVAFTANVLQRSKERALISGCEGFISKPINRDTFYPQLVEYINGKKEFVDSDKIHELMKEHNVELVNHLEKEIKELKNVNKELKEIDKIKSDFISIASHELRTPLVTIVGYLGLLLSGRLGDVSPEHKKILSVVERNSHRLEKIVKDLFTLSILENKKPFFEKNNASVVNMIQEIIDDNLLIFEQRELGYSVEADENVPLIECDEHKIIQVFSHLVNNAIKYTENKGHIDVKIKYPAIHLNKRYDVDSSKFIEVEVSDTGIGIPEDKLDKIFEKFVELSEVEKHHSSEYEFMGGGTGLGLSLSKAIVKRHRGYIWAENSEEKGASFFVFLPLLVEENPIFN